MDDPDGGAGVGAEVLTQVAISALQHHAYCPRQCALIHLDGAWEENLSSQRGRLAHERIDLGGHETAHGTRLEHGLPLWSERLGLIGRADAVEFRADGTVYPVEYKHGARKRRHADDIQLCAQALCLEEMLGRSVLRGAIFHIRSRRRREVGFDEALRRGVVATVEAVRRMLMERRLPPPINDRRCDDCSLRGVCMPEVGGTTHAAWLFEPVGSRS